MWLHMPDQYRRSFETMMARLVAEESQMRLNELIIAGGRVAKDDAYQQFTLELTQRASGETTVRRRRRAPKLTSLSQISQFSAGAIDVIQEDVTSIPWAGSITSFKPGEYPTPRQAAGKEVDRE